MIGDPDAGEKEDREHCGYDFGQCGALPDAYIHKNGHHAFVFPVAQPEAETVMLHRYMGMLNGKRTGWSKWQECPGEAADHDIGEWEHATATITRRK